MKYIVLSPDGFPIERDKTYSSKKKAKVALNNWIKRYESQGYYSTMNRLKIPLSDIVEYCDIKEI